MLKLLRDPLVHFLLAGALLFALLDWRDDVADPEQIVIGSDDVRQLLAAATTMRGRELTPEELDAIVEPMIRDEVYYREALALGLDEDDDSVRTRLIEKMRYLTEDLADPEPASDEELRAFYAENPRRFLIPEMVTFEQRFFNPRERGESISADVEAALGELQSGADPSRFGDSTPLREKFEDAPREQVAVLFGDAIADALFSMPAGEWRGPYESDFGLHLIRLAVRTEARQPAFDEIRDTVMETFAADRRRERNESTYRAMRDRYDIVVEWPATSAMAKAGGE
jgi:peptidyl-prolyl cis-trans isomerase C